MSNFSQFLTTQTTQAIINGPGLTANSITERPSILAFFTTDAPIVKLHWHKDQGHYVCPGEGCPACEVDKPPRDTFLFPVINLPRHRVEVLRVPHIVNPDGTLISDSLIMGIAALMSDPSITDKVAKVSKSGSYRYAVDPVSGTIPLESKMLIQNLVTKFQSDLATGAISLEDFYPRLTAEEIREIPSIHEGLKLCGLLGTDELDDDSPDPADAV